MAGTWMDLGKSQILVILYISDITCAWNFCAALLLLIFTITICRVSMNRPCSGCDWIASTEPLTTWPVPIGTVTTWIKWRLKSILSHLSFGYPATLSSWFPGLNKHFCECQHKWAGTSCLTSCFQWGILRFRGKNLSPILTQPSTNRAVEGTMWIDFNTNPVNWPAFASQ